MLRLARGNASACSDRRVSRIESALYDLATRIRATAARVRAAQHGFGSDALALRGTGIAKIGA